jgi:hypothetical protein
MADITAEIPTVEEVLTRAAAASDVSTIVSEALERRSSNSSVAAFSPFIVADVKDVNDIPEVSMTESIYNARSQIEAPAPTPLPVEELPVIDTVTAALPDSTESSDDESEPLIPISHRPLEIADTVMESATEDVVEPDATATQGVEDDEDASEESEDEDTMEEEESEEEENTIHSDDEETEKPQQEQNLAAQIPVEIMFLLFTVLILNFFNFLLTLTGARQCIRPF